MGNECDMLNNLTPQYLNVFKLVSQISTRRIPEKVLAALFYTFPRCEQNIIKGLLAFHRQFYGTNFQSLSEIVVLLYHLSRTICNII